MKTKLKPGFHAFKKQDIKLYVSYYILQGIWIYSDSRKPVKCWATFTPDKTFLGCSMSFLDAKEKVKTHKINLVMRKR
jgi:hypothetical protein